MVIGGLLSVISSRDKIELVDQRFFAIDITERSGEAVPSIKHKQTHTCISSPYCGHFTQGRNITIYVLCILR